MAHCSKYTRRFAKALDYRKIPMPTEMVAVISKRAKSDGQIDAAIHCLLNILEPPGCIVGHCKHHTSYSFCGCSIDRIPGNCPIQKNYIKDREAKYQIIRDEMINLYGQTVQQSADAFNSLMNKGGYSRAKAEWEKYKNKHKPSVKQSKRLNCKK